MRSAANLGKEAIPHFNIVMSALHCFSLRQDLLCSFPVSYFLISFDFISDNPVRLLY